RAAARRGGAVVGASAEGLWMEADCVGRGDRADRRARTSGAPGDPVALPDRGGAGRGGRRDGRRHERRRGRARMIGWLKRRFTRRAPERETDPLAAWDERLQVLSRRTSDLRRSAATLLAMRGE